MSEPIILERARNSLSEIPDFIIHVDEPVWNVVVFICLNLVALPVLEYLSDLLVRKTATMKVLKDERILLSDSRLGILSLYSTYYGRHRCHMFMILLGVMVIVMETFAEFCSSSVELSEQTRVDVWKIEDWKNYSYIHGDTGVGRGRQPRNQNGGEDDYSAAEIVTLREDRLESVMHSKDCIFGVENFVLGLNDSGSRVDFEPVIRSHYMETLLSSSKLYLSKDNSSIVCDYFKSRPRVIEVWMPAVGKGNDTYFTAPARNRALRKDARPPINWSKGIRIGQSLHTAYGFRNGKSGVDRKDEDSYTCLQMFEEDECGDTCESVACAFYAVRNYTLIFGFGEGSVVTTKEGPIADIRRWRMESRTDIADDKSKGQGESNGVKQSKKNLKDSKVVTLSDRTVRFVERMYLEGYIWASQNEEVERRRVVTMTRYERSLRSEALVNGELRKLESTFIQPRPDFVRQVPTITVFAVIPILLFLLVVSFQLLMLRRLERKIRMRKMTRGVSKGAAKVETSMQWFRKDFVKLLESQGLHAELEDISLRLVRTSGKSRLGILPHIDTSSNQKP